MFYLSENEIAIRRTFTFLSLFLLVAIYIISYYAFDPCYKNAFYGFPIAFIIYILLKCLLTRQRAGASRPFYAQKSRFIKLAIYTAFCNFCFFALQYCVFFPIQNQKFVPATMTNAGFTEYSGSSTKTGDTYWSLEFSIAGEDLQENPAYTRNFETGATDYTVDLNDTFVGCGCGVEYGDWGDIVMNPSLPFKYYDDKFGVDGIKLPTWLCICFSEAACERKYTGDDVQGVTLNNLFYRIVGDPVLALKNQKCPPDDMNFLQVYREDEGVPAHDQVLLSFLFAFSSAMASAALFLTMGFILLTVNYGHRITFVVLNSVASISLELTVLFNEDLYDDVLLKFVPFMISFFGSGYIYGIIMVNDIRNIGKVLWTKFLKIFSYEGFSEKLIVKIGSTLWKIIWFIIGCFWAVFSLIFIIWFKGRCKIFALTGFKLDEDKYSMIYEKKEIKDKNILFNVITIIDSVFFRGGQGTLFLHLLISGAAKDALLVTVAFIFVMYEFLSCLYPLVKQVYLLKGISVMLESLNPRYYNVAVVRRERVLKVPVTKEIVKERRRNSEERIELQGVGSEVQITHHNQP